MLIAVDSPTALRLLRIYGINVPVTDERFESDHTFDAGIAVTIDGVAEPELGWCIRLKIGKQRGSRMCPVTERDAEDLVAEFHESNVLPSDDKWDRTLVQLLVKCSKLFVEGGMGEFHLLLYLTPQGYRTHAVYMMRSRKNPSKFTRDSV